METKTTRIISLILFLIGTFFLSNSQINITGAVIGYTILPVISSILGFSFILVSLILFATTYIEEETLESKVKYDPNVKSFRRWLEKHEDKKFSYNQAELAYRNVEKKYWEAVDKGIIKYPEKNKPLQFVEEYIEKHREYIDNLNIKKEEILNAAGTSLKERRIYTKVRELKSLATRCGYDISETSKEGTLVKDTETGSKITVIPNHLKSGQIHLCREIMRSMATGKSSFRQIYKTKKAN